MFLLIDIILDDKTRSIVLSIRKIVIIIVIEPSTYLKYNCGRLSNY